MHNLEAIDAKATGHWLYYMRRNTLKGRRLQTRGRNCDDRLKELLNLHVSN